MSTFGQRHGYQRKVLSRDRREEAPQALRAYLHDFLIDVLGAMDAYRELCRKAGVVPDSQIWGADWARPEVSRLLEKLHWIDVFELLEKHATSSRAGGIDREKLNEVFARCGLAYEMTDSGEIELWDPESNELGVAGDEHLAEDILVGDLAPIKQQYLRALSAIHGRPSDPEKAVSESLGALEAVARVASGKKDFGRAIESLLSGDGWSKALAESLKKLYGYASQLPGARHGRHADPELELEEALYVVRACGAAIAYLTYLHRE